MSQQPSQQTTPLWQKLFSLTLACALIPVMLCGLLLWFSSDAASFASLVYTPVIESVENQLKVSIDAHGERVDTRMERIGSSILQLQALGEEVLSSPEFYGAFEDPNATEEEGSEEQESDPVSVLEEAESSLDNPLYYSVGDSGALRKLIDDGGSAVYFAEHGGFTTLDMHRVYATAALDPLLIQPVKDDPLVSRSFVITGDNLLRMYPFQDTGSWDPHMEFSKPFSYWSAAKAKDNGLVWTVPYRSRFEDMWVVACLAQVQVGGSTAAVVGCELPLATFSDRLLSFSLGLGGLCWLSHEQNDEAGLPACTVIAAQSGAGEFLKLTPVAMASLPDDSMPAAKLLEEANIYSRSPDQVATLMKQATAVGSSAYPLNPAEGQFLASVNIPSVGWKLSGIIENPAMAAVQAYQQQSNKNLERLLIQLGIIVILSILLAFFVALFFGRRLGSQLSAIREVALGNADPEQVDTQLRELNQLAQAVAQDPRQPVQIADEEVMHTTDSESDSNDVDQA